MILLAYVLCAALAIAGIAFCHTHRQMNAAAIGLDSSSDLLISSTSTTGFWPYPIER